MSTVPQTLGPRRPVPNPDRDTAQHFAAAARGELALPRCDDCSGFHWYPSKRCPACGSWNVNWATVSSRGSLYSYTIVGHPLGSWFADRVPYPMGLVELDDAPGVRLVTDIVDVDCSEVHIGMPLEAEFDKLTEDVGLVHFRPATRTA